MSSNFFFFCRQKCRENRSEKLYCSGLFVHWNWVDIVFAILIFCCVLPSKVRQIIFSPGLGNVFAKTDLRKANTVVEDFFLSCSMMLSILLKSDSDGLFFWIVFFWWNVNFGLCLKRLTGNWWWQNTLVLLHFSYFWQLFYDNSQISWHHSNPLQQKRKFHS